MVFGFDLPASLEQAANVIGGIGRATNPKLRLTWMQALQ
jgi:hypothetical protein